MEDKKIKTSVYLEREFYKFLKIAAIEEGKSYSQLVEDALREKYEFAYGKKVKIE